MIAPALHARTKLSFATFTMQTVHYHKTQSDTQAKSVVKLSPYRRDVMHCFTWILERK